MRASAFAEDAFAILEAGMGAGELDEATTERIVLSLMRFELDAREALRALAPPRGSAEIEAALHLEAATRETLRAALVYNDYAAVRTPVVSTLGRLGVEVSEDSVCWRALGRKAARALIEVSDENARSEQGHYAGSMLSWLNSPSKGLPIDIRSLPPKPAEHATAFDARALVPLQVEAPAQTPSVEAPAHMHIAAAPASMQIVDAPAPGPVEGPFVRDVSPSPRVERAASTARQNAPVAQAQRDPRPVTLTPAE